MRSLEILYLCSGLLLPLFYAPQIAKLLSDSSGLASYSLSKAAVQGALRFPALLFGMFVVQNTLFIAIVALDLLGRSVEFAVAIRALVRHGCSPREILLRVLPVHALRTPRRRPAPAFDLYSSAPALALAPDEPLVLPEHATGQI